MADDNHAANRSVRSNSYVFLFQKNYALNGNTEKNSGQFGV